MIRITVTLLVHRIVNRVIPFAARLHHKNWDKNSWEYPQLWYCWPWWFKGRRDTIHRKILELICKVFTGHEISNTEWGYGGGDYIDFNCRWCDKVIKGHRKEVILPKEMEAIIKNSGLI